MSKMYLSNLVCRCCDNVFLVPREKADRRAKGHVKHLWCFKCKDTTEHVEQAVRHLERDIASF